jgi:hypothetical protein
MTSHSTMPNQPQSETETAVHLFDNWFDPIEAVLRDRARDFLQAMFEAELDEVLDRSRYVRRAERMQLPTGSYLRASVAPAYSRMAAILGAKPCAAWRQAHRRRSKELERSRA